MEGEQRIVEEFYALLERTQQLFSGLRDVPHFGKQWQPYFQRTFEVYTKLWKFQQIHRSLLEKEKGVGAGLKRYEIGDIASKIGQLYYHYYLRTSETNYLYESYVFYEAIRSRQYFKDVLEAKSGVLMVKKLRYYARFVVVCLLLNKRQMVEELAQELQQSVDEYIKTYRPGDTQEWQFVLQEINLFLKGDGALMVESGKIKSAPPSCRLQKPEEENAVLRVQEAILVGNYQHQVKFSELTLDMFRLMQALEREPLVVDDKNNSELKQEERLDRKRRTNPHKYLLYRPTFSQLMAFLATSFKELLDNNVLLLYLSSDGIKANPNHHLNNNNNNGSIAGDVGGESFRKGGISLNSRRLPDAAVSANNPDCLYPEDLIPFTRKHLFLIVDSDNSSAFCISSYYGKEVLCLLSPSSQPKEILDSTKAGNLFTFFLYDPIAAFCFVSNLSVVNKDLYDKAKLQISKVFDELITLLETHPTIPSAVRLFIREEFLKSLVINFIFCMATCMYHKYFNNFDKFLPQLYPPIPPEFYRQTSVVNTLYHLYEILGISDFLILP